MGKYNTTPLWHYLIQILWQQACCRTEQHIHTIHVLVLSNYESCINLPMKHEIIALIFLYSLETSEIGLIGLDYLTINILHVSKQNCKQET